MAISCVLSGRIYFKIKFVKDSFWRWKSFLKGSLFLDKIQKDETDPCLICILETFCQLDYQEGSSRKSKYKLQIIFWWEIKKIQTNQGTKGLIWDEGISDLTDKKL